MKKKTKKLVLAKETLRSLEELTLSKAAGGSGFVSCTPHSCPYCDWQPITDGGTCLC
jgi:hypothetical protein